MVSKIVSIQSLIIVLYEYIQHNNVDFPSKYIGFSFTFQLFSPDELVRCNVKWNASNYYKLLTSIFTQVIAALFITANSLPFPQNQPNAQVQSQPQQPSGPSTTPVPIISQNDVDNGDGNFTFG